MQPKTKISKSETPTWNFFLIMWNMLLRKRITHFKSTQWWDYYNLILNSIAKNLYTCILKPWRYSLSTWKPFFFPVSSKNVWILSLKKYKLIKVTIYLNVGLTIQTTLIQTVPYMINTESPLKILAQIMSYLRSINDKD